MNKEFTRRRFLQLVGKGIAAATLASCTYSTRSDVHERVVLWAADPLHPTIPELTSRFNDVFPEELEFSSKKHELESYDPKVVYTSDRFDPLGVPPCTVIMLEEPFKDPEGDGEWITYVFYRNNDGTDLSLMNVLDLKIGRAKDLLVNNDRLKYYFGIRVIKPNQGDNFTLVLNTEIPLVSAVEDKFNRPTVGLLIALGKIRQDGTFVDRSKRVLQINLGQNPLGPIKV